MMQQYFQAKEAHPGVLVAMRVGDFYEFYGEDAETAARILEITLTGRDDGGERIAMAGVPYHSVEKYLARLVAAGQKVALCDQLEDPKKAKGLVKRGVTRVLTPGTVLEDSMLAQSANSFLAAICVRDDRVGLAFLDPSTGEFAVTEFTGGEREQILLQELARLRPTELLVSDPSDPAASLASSTFGASLTEAKPPTPDRAQRHLKERFDVANLDGFGCANLPCAVAAASMVLGYAEHNGLALGHLEGLVTYSVGEFMSLDPATRRSLELTQNLSDGSRRYTLLEVLDETVTPMGARLLRRWIDQPLLDADRITQRHDAIERLLLPGLVREEIRDVLRPVADLERLVSRCSTGLAGPRDLTGLRDALGRLPLLSDPLRKVGIGRLQDLRESISTHDALWQLLREALVDDPPHHLRDGGVIRADWDPELRSLRELMRNGRSYIAELEQRERQATGIEKLKVGFNSVFGYYLEVSKSNLDRVPDHYIRKQTTAGAERFITAELKEQESRVLGAEEKAMAMEAELFQSLRARVAEQSHDLLRTARALAELDVLTAMAHVALYRNYVRPRLVETNVLAVEGGRHPVVEAYAPSFVPNDTTLAPDASLMILTGPNMSGKSTYLRQNALLVLMAQIGSYVPAKAATVGLCDRVFARIGAKDELALGQSTFMVEMIESANILNHATQKSLVILDEVGRGTSTYDGLAIAWAMVERLAEMGAKTLFATHYHQLNTLASTIPNVRNYRVSVEEVGDRIVWTHRVLPGGTDRSYGIHVAKMAGLPASVLRRAAEVLADLEERASPAVRPPARQALQLTLFEAEEPEVVRSLRELSVESLTPLQALQLLDEWQRRYATPGS